MRVNDDGSITLSDEEQRDKAEFIAGLREFADWLELKPIDAPRSCRRILFCVHSTCDLIAVRRACALSEKNMEGDYVHFAKRFRGGISFSLFASKELTCERVKVGTKIIPAKPEMVLPATPEREEEIFEWRCPDSILEAAH
jgi:hypothetical protein